VLKTGRKIAEHLAKILPPEKTILIDAFAGAGGNSIAFALSGRFKQIFAIEKDPEVLKCAKHNAEIYGVKKGKIWWVNGDCFDILPKRYKNSGKDAVIFASPPWGGMLPFLRYSLYPTDILSRAWIHRGRDLQPLYYGAVQSRISVHQFLKNSITRCPLPPKNIEFESGRKICQRWWSSPSHALLYERSEQGINHLLI
jgi:tRNA G37 N-methylase Trm5